MEANEPNTTAQTSFILLNNELEKIQGRLDVLEDKINLLCNGMNILIQSAKNINKSKQYKSSMQTLVDQLPDDDKLDEFEDREGTCNDYSRVIDDQLSEKEIAPFLSKDNKLEESD